MRLEILKNSKHKDESINYGKDNVEIKCIEFFIWAQSSKQLALMNARKAKV
jgi:hypothetical protein